jgi:hypothetical protein
VEQIIGDLPTSYALQQNFPNPFNPSTEIRFDLPKAGIVTIVVYSILGQKVADLVDEFKAAGAFSVRFNAANLASGTYLYSMRVNGFKAVRKLTILK